MKYYFQTPDGVYLTGWTLTPQMDGDVVIMEHYVIITNPPQDMLDHPNHYKIKDGEPVKLSNDELPQLSPIEELQKENKLLKAQVQALTDQGEFQDDLIAELAMIVYA